MTNAILDKGWAGLDEPQAPGCAVIRRAARCIHLLLARASPEPPEGSGVGNAVPPCAHKLAAGLRLGRCLCLWAHVRRRADVPSDRGHSVVSVRSLCFPKDLTHMQHVAAPWHNKMHYWPCSALARAWGTMCRCVVHAAMAVRCTFRPPAWDRPSIPICNA